MAALYETVTTHGAMGRHSFLPLLTTTLGERGYSPFFFPNDKLETQIYEVSWSGAHSGGVEGDDEGLSPMRPVLKACSVTFPPEAAADTRLCNLGGH